MARRAHLRIPTHLVSRSAVNGRNYRVESSAAEPVHSIWQDRRSMTRQAYATRLPGRAAPLLLPQEVGPSGRACITRRRQARSRARRERPLQARPLSFRPALPPAIRSASRVAGSPTGQLPTRGRAPQPQRPLPPAPSTRPPPKQYERDNPRNRRDDNQRERA